MKRFTILTAVAMLALSGPAFSTQPANPCGNHGNNCDTGGGAGGAGGDAVAGATAGAIAVAGAAAGAIATNEVDVRNTSTNTNLVNTSVRNDVENTNAQQQGQVQGQLQGQVAFGGNSTSTGGSIVINGSSNSEGEGSGTAPFSSNLTVAEGAVQASQTQSATATVAEGAVATSQEQTANGGNVAEGAVTNNVDVNVTTGDPNAPREVTPVIVNKTVIPVASAAPSFSSICSSGAGGQGSSWGVSLAVTSDVCTMLQMADAYMALGDRETAMEYVEKAGAHAKTKGFVGYLRHIVTLGIL